MQISTRTTILSALLLIVGLSAYADENVSKWYFGLGGGYRFSFMNYSDIDESVFPENKALGSGIFSVFVQGEFGQNNNFAIRPQISFLNRGGKLTEIYNSGDYYETEEIEDVNYVLKAHYIDLRIPLIYQFGKTSSKIRPYVYLAPVLGFTTGGSIEFVQENEDGSFAGYKTDISDANMSSTYFAGQVGLGVKFAIPVYDNTCYFGIEANYEYGFTDTYASKEKDGEANDVAQLFTSNYKIDGTRKFSGVEIQATISIPFSIFSKKVKKAEEPVTYIPVEVPTETYVEPVVEQKPCYTLEEINDLMLSNKSVEGLTICAVDAITFDFSQSTIKPESYQYLDQLANTLIRTNRRIEVKGHTDNVGSEEFNLNLSRERAESVIEYLVKKGVNRNKLTYSYYGMSKPLTSNDTEEGRATNRRVEFTILNNF